MVVTASCDGLLVWSREQTVTLQENRWELTEKGSNVILKKKGWCVGQLLLERIFRYRVLVTSNSNPLWNTTARWLGKYTSIHSVLYFRRDLSQSGKVFHSWSKILVSSHPWVVARCCIFDGAPQVSMVAVRKGSSICLGIRASKLDTLCRNGEFWVRNPWQRPFLLKLFSLFLCIQGPKQYETKRSTLRYSFILFSTRTRVFTFPFLRVPHSFRNKRSELLN